MIGTLSMLALVALGFSHIDPFVIIPIAILNALVGLPQVDPDAQQGAVSAQPAPCTLAGFNRVLPMQMVYAGIGYGLGVGLDVALRWML